MSELKLCPFCGGEVSIALHGDEFGDYWWSVQRGHNNETACKCRLFMESSARFTLDDDEQAKNDPYAQKLRAKLVDKWNTRQHLEDGWVTATEENMAKFGWYRRETCKQMLTECNDGLMPPLIAHCSKCGAEWGYTPNFCPNCGAKVVGA